MLLAGARCGNCCKRLRRENTRIYFVVDLHKTSSDSARRYISHDGILPKNVKKEKVSQLNHLNFPSFAATFSLSLFIKDIFLQFFFFH